MPRSYFNNLQSCVENMDGIVLFTFLEKWGVRDKGDMEEGLGEIVEGRDPSRIASLLLSTRNAINTLVSSEVVIMTIALRP